jgi:hypothetical protein
MLFLTVQLGAETEHEAFLRLLFILQSPGINSLQVFNVFLVRSAAPAKLSF